MEAPLLSNRDQYPTEEIIFPHLGKAKSLWIDLFRHIHKTYPDFVEEWRYYNDGKSWLLKVTRKTKTICWISIVKSAFRLSCYFSGKAEKIITESELPQEYKDQYSQGKKYHGITILFKDKKDLEKAKILLQLKLKFK
jgi:hypothetical protein